MKKRFGTPLTVILLAVCCQALLSPPIAQAAPALPDMSVIAREAMPAVVNIYALKEKPRPTLSELLHSNLGIYDALSTWISNRYKVLYVESDTGSGFFINKRGYILTNYHVVADADRIIVRVAHRAEYEQDARLLGNDPASDVALLKVPGDYRHHVLPLGNSDTLEPGAWVLAIGNPYGVGKTFTAGVVSAVKRSGLGLIEMEDFIQTDAAISPGNSGGPLVNINGEAVGINTAVQSGGAGIAFAVPINIAKAIMPRLAAGKRIRRGTLGLTGEDLTSEAAQHLRIEDGLGVLVTAILRGGPAQSAGIQLNDVITSFNGEKILHYAQLKKAVLSLTPGTKVKMTIVRERKTLTVKAVLAEVKLKRS